MIVLLAFVCRDSIADLVEARLGLEGLFTIILGVLSTPAVRFLCAAIVATVLATAALLLSPARWTGYFCVLGLAGTLTLTSLWLTGSSAWLALLPMTVLFSNLAPPVLLGPDRRRVPRAFLWIGAGMAETLLMAPYLRWIRHSSHEAMEPARTGGQGIRFAAVIGSCGLAAGLLGVSLRAETLVPLEQRLRMSAHAEIIGRGNLNHLALDTSGNCLYAASDRIQCYSLDDVHAQPRETDRFAQSFGFSQDTREIFVYNRAEASLMTFVTPTLSWSHSVLGMGLADGDTWVAVDSTTGTVTIASETNALDGSPIAIVDRTTGKVIQRLPYQDNSFIMRHPRFPILYLSFFPTKARRLPQRRGVMRYDLQRRRPTHEALVDLRLDRLAFWDGGDELFAADPTHSRVLRLDPNTLELRGVVRSMLGVRSLAVDNQRALLLTGSTVSGRLQVTDLRTGNVLATYYLGPWLRTIVVEAESGIAFVSANGTLYRLQYAVGLRRR